MIREEAINKLNWALDNNTIEDVQSAYDYIIALKMAIQALEQEPCEDYVSRDALLNQFCTISPYETYSVSEIVQIINELPSVQPTRIHSRWINPECQADGTFTITCKYCGAIVNTNFYSGNIDFCPRCGCYMSERGINELETFSVKQGVSLEDLDEDAKETVSHLIECYEDDCFTKDERVTLAGIALQARLRFQLNMYYNEQENRNVDMKGQN